MSDSISHPATAQRETILAEHTKLEAGVLGLPGAIMQGVALIAPAIAALFFVPFVVSLAGQNAPLVYPIGLALGIYWLCDPGRGGCSFSRCNPSHVGEGGITWSGFGLAAIFAVQAYSGWDGAAPLAEETADPKRNVPRGVMWSIVILGLLL